MTLNVCSGTLPEELKKRGVFAQDVLPNYHFRNDAILLWDAISEYVTDYVNLYYPEATMLKQDHELQVMVLSVDNIII